MTEVLAEFLATHGLWAVFVLMAIDAVFPTASELIMLYAGALASGALAHDLVVFGTERSGFDAFVIVSLAGSIGYLVGSIGGWAIGVYGGRPFLERRGRWLHLGPTRMGRRSAGSTAGATGPCSRPAHAARPLVHLDPRRRLRGAARAATRCSPRSAARSGRSRFAAAGYALGANWEEFHHAFRYVEYVVAAGIVARRRCTWSSAGGAPLRWAGVQPIPLVDVKAQYAPFIPELKDAFARALDSGRFIFGPEVEGFEREAAEYLGVEQTIGVANGTDALVLALDAMEIGDGDEVICPAFTFFATAEAIARRGRDARLRRHRPGHAEPRPRRGRARDHRADEGDHARAPFRPAGADRGAARASASRSSRTPRRRSARTGSPPSVASTFSFFPSKNLFALGDGGLIACNDADLADRIRMLRFHGSRAKKDFEYVGYNSRLDAIQAAALRIFLPHLDEWTRLRREAAARYAELGLAELAELPQDEPGHVYHMYAVRTPERDRARRSARATPASATRASTRRRSTSSRRCATWATRRVTCPRPRRPHAKTFACRSGAASRGSSRSRSPRVLRQRIEPRRSGDRPSGHPAPPLAAARRRAADPLAWRLTFFLRFDDDVPRFYREFLSWQVIAVVLAINLATFIALRLLQPLVALRLDARHVGRRARRHDRLAAHATSCCSRSRPSTPRRCRAASPRSTSCSCSRSSRARACSRARCSSGRSPGSSRTGKRC